MGYELYAIKPEHWEKYGPESMDVLHDLIATDKWYTDSARATYHKISRSWRAAYSEDDDGNREDFPDSLEGFYFCVHDPTSAKTTAYDLEDFAGGKDRKVTEFVRWLRFWADKDARFYLSR